MLRQLGRTQQPYLEARLLHALLQETPELREVDLARAVGIEVREHFLDVLLA